MSHSPKEDARAPTTRHSNAEPTAIAWDDPHADAIDGFTVGEVVTMVIDSVVPARCTECRAEHEVEPDAEGYDCESCGANGTVTSPLIKVGLI